MTGTALLIGQIVTGLLFCAIGAGLIWWLFRPSVNREAPRPVEEELRPAPGQAEAPRVKVRLTAPPSPGQRGDPPR